MQNVIEILSTRIFTASGSPDSRDSDKLLARKFGRELTEFISKIGLGNYLSLIRPSVESIEAPPIVFPPETTQPELDFAGTLNDAEWHSHNGCWRIRMNDHIAKRYCEMMAAIDNPSVFTLVRDEKGEWIQRDI